MVIWKPEQGCFKFIQELSNSAMVEIATKTNFYVISLILIINRYKEAYTQNYFIIIAALELTV